MSIYRHESQDSSTNDLHFPSTSQAARHYLARGYQPVPFAYGTKGPTAKGWNELRITAAEVDDHFPPHQQNNIGLLTGEPSKNLTDVDLDAVEALAVAPFLLPPTGMVHGRQGKPASHWWYEVDQPQRSRQFKDPSGKPGTTAMLVELRGTGVQTTVPPSVHPSGEPIVWHQAGSPARVPYHQLLDAVRRVAAASLLARHWPAEGCRQDAALALAGGLLRAGFSGDEAEEFVRAVATAAGDEEAGVRVKTVACTARKLAGGDPAKGWPSLAELVGEKVIGQVCGWLGGGKVRGRAADGLADANPHPEPDAATVGRPGIVVNDRQLRDVCRDAVAAVVNANEPPRLFLRGGAVSHLDDASQDGPVFGLLNECKLLSVLAEVADWYKVRVGKDGGEQQAHAHPPANVLRALLGKADWPLPAVKGVLYAPTFLADGRVLLRPGYDPASGYYLHQDASLGAMPALSPTPAGPEVARAKEVLLTEVLADFPFAAQADRAHALALFLLPLVRPLIDGPTPLHVLDAPKEGTGKGLLASAFALVATGQDLDGMTQPGGEEEWRKELLATLLAGKPITLLDNVARPLNSATLASVLTARRYTGRVLGASRQVTLPVECCWVVTGNNVHATGEITRRVVRVRLDARLERPTQRRGFRHQNLLRWVREHRGDLVWACLTLVRNWLARGRVPGAATLGSYEVWAAVLGGILDAAGVPGFLGNLKEQYAEVNSSEADWHGFFAAWFGAFQDRPVRPADVYGLALRELPGVLDARDDRGNVIKLGYALANRLHDVQGGLRLERAGEEHRSKLYRLAEVAAPEESGAKASGGGEVPAGVPACTPEAAAVLAC